MFPSKSRSRNSSDTRNGLPMHVGWVAWVVLSAFGWTLIPVQELPGQTSGDLSELHQFAIAAWESGQIIPGPLSSRDDSKPGYSEMPRGAILVGFDIALGQEGVSGLRPIYRVPTGYYSTRGLGVFAAGMERNDFVIQVRAKPGYAVGAVRLRQSDAVRAVNLVYRKVKGTVLDVEDAYESGWAGNTKVGNEVVLEGHGWAIVGILAPAEGSDRVPALGLNCLLTSLSGDRPSATTFFANGTKETRYAADPSDESSEDSEIPQRAVLISLVMFGLVMLPVLVLGAWFLAVRGRGSRRRSGSATGQLTLSARQENVARQESPARQEESARQDVFSRPETLARREAAGRPPEIRLRFRR